MLRVRDQAESVFRLRNFNMCMKMVVWLKHVAQLNE
jgi:hypothetical protein